MLGFYSTSQLLQSIPNLKKTTLRSLLRRKFIMPEKLGKIYLFKDSDKEKIIQYITSKNG
jgi:3-dehydroquinate synthetase